MIDTIYIERAVAENPRALRIVERFPKALTVPIERYGEIFNRRQQNFRLQKRNPSLVLAEKHGNLVLPAPPGYGIGATKNFYFSHVLNCPYDCRYCFLQGMYQSAHYVLFVNYEDFQDAVVDTTNDAHGADVTFFSGYDGDSLALDHVTGFVDAFVPFFADHPAAFLELRTKSVAVRPLLAHEPQGNVIVAFSFTPDAASKALEHGVPPLDARIQAMQRLAERGFRLGVRFDPLLYAPGYRELYRELFETVFLHIDSASLHSVSFGPFRMPRDYFQKMAKLYPDERLFAGLSEDRPMVSYPGDVEKEMRAFCEEQLSRLVPESVLFPCRI